MKNIITLVKQGRNILKIGGIILVIYDTLNFFFEKLDERFPDENEPN